ncbi:hypothetical protein [Streptomyces sp. NBC_00859]|uniref:hypothetical protein n=1 Tax=Streptomyces sp. NBC_00859 TaxID=2903682 RepID=UPI003868FF59|nr:hypothetical protein OG584_31480 [Streptomyces sp. NBC_00859]
MAHDDSHQLLHSSASNFSCKGVRNIDYSKPGARDFTNSWADEFASRRGQREAGRGRSVQGRRM